MDATGNFVVTWTDRVSSANTDVKAQRYFANGLRNGGIITIAGSARNESDSSVGMSQSGNFVVSYTVQNSTDRDIHARRFANTGTLLSTIIVAGTQNDELHSSLARCPDGRFSIAFEVSDGESNRDVTLQRYTASGKNIGTHAIGTDLKPDRAPDVAMDRFGNTIVVWAHETSPSPGPFLSANHDILARKVFATAPSAQT